eukprot:11162734-Lingulodinium_polyedra.AAC.1
MDPDARQLYVADSGNNAVRRVDLDTGSISMVAGTAPSGADPGLATEELHSPNGVAVDPATGQLYIADTGNHA